MKFAVCLDPLFPGQKDSDKIALIAQAGFKYVDFWSWRDKDIAAMVTACQMHGVQVINFNGHRNGSMVAEQTHPDLFADFRDTIPVARMLGANNLMSITNQLNTDGSAHPYLEISEEKKLKNVTIALSRMMDLLPGDMHLMLEPLNTRVDHPGYWLTDFDTALSIVREIRDPRLQLLCDLYHMGVMGNDLINLIDTYLPYIGYFHVADFPGRHEPGTGSADWTGILRHLHEKGYQGYLSFEYFPLEDTMESLGKIRRLVDQI